MALTNNDIISELGYAYLHAVASKAGCASRPSSRQVDNHKIDAEVMGFKDYGPGRYSPANLWFQLKSTYQTLTRTPGGFSYELDVATYNFLRTANGQCPIYLLVMSLPRDNAKWCSVGPSLLSLRHCTYWLCLYGAKPTTNKETLTVRLPKTQLLTVKALDQLLEWSARNDRQTYGDA